MNPWVILGVVLVWLASLVGVGKWQREDGALAERSAVLARDNAALVQANETIDRLNREARAKEQEHVAAMNALGADYETQLAAARAQKEIDAAAIRAGERKLRVATSRICPGGSSAPEVGPATASRDGPATVELPAEITGRLFDLANDADQVADQLRACQAVIVRDRI